LDEESAGERYAQIAVASPMPALPLRADVKFEKNASNAPLDLTNLEPHRSLAAATTGPPPPMPDAARIHPAILVLVNSILGIVSIAALIGIWLDPG
jgi:hypothetical protein